MRPWFLGFSVLPARHAASGQALSGTDTWAHPVLANGRLYVRSQDELLALDVQK